MSVRKYKAMFEQDRYCAEQARSAGNIDRIHKWRLSNYSFVFMLIILTSLVNTSKIQKNFSSKVRLVRMISTKTKE